MKERVLHRLVWCVGICSSVKCFRRELEVHLKGIAELTLAHPFTQSLEVCVYRVSTQTQFKKCGSQEGVLHPASEKPCRERYSSGGAAQLPVASGSDCALICLSTEMGKELTGEPVSQPHFY